MSIKILADLTISPSTLPNGHIGTPYAQVLTASGGIAPYTWSIDSGSLPTGLSLNTLTGAITGIPIAEGDFPFTKKVVDVIGSSGTQSYD